MTFASDDFKRHVFADALVEVRGLREVPTLRRSRLLRATCDSAYKHIRDGVRDEAELCELVQADLEGAYGSIILMAVLAAVIQFVVMKILKRLFPDTPTTAQGDDA